MNKFVALGWPSDWKTCTRASIRINRIYDCSPNKVGYYADAEIGRQHRLFIKQYELVPKTHEDGGKARCTICSF